MDNDIINANPTKDFFISMLTRDIDIRAAILELIDNSIDGAKKIRKDNNYDGLYIKIKFDTESFSIEDNCGGIDIFTAQNHAFRFGRSNKQSETGIYTGVFGIGMKRSLFRMGRYFEVISKTEKDSFEVKVDVDEWINDEDKDWTFKFNKTERNVINPIEKCGTTIIISKIYSGISENFGIDYFENNLIDYIEKYRTIAAENGLKIYINDKLITFLQDELIYSRYIKPYTNSEDIGNINIKVIAGAVPMGLPQKAGWYIYCNGRMIVYADKTELTGWGDDDGKSYHPSLAFFRGYVFFESTDLEALPWNTTKTSVDTSSKYYIAAKNMMKVATVQITELKNSINSVNNEDKREQAKTIMLNNAERITLTTTEIEKLSSKENNFYYKLPIEEDLIKMSTITFKEEREKVEFLKNLMGVSTNKEVGERLFDYYYLRECEE